MRIVPSAGFALGDALAQCSYRSPDPQYTDISSASADWLRSYQYCYGKIPPMKVALDAAGRLVVPKTLRQALGIKPGQALGIRAGDGRLEIEIAMLEGSVEVKDLPVLWNERFNEYLGITPPDDAKGVLQDVHWSFGLLGYFSTYALGNLVSVQLWERINRDIPDLEEQIRRGEFSALLSWLRENIHRHGRKFEPQELVERVTGSKIDPAPYVRYLRDKYAQIYEFGNMPI